MFFNSLSLCNHWPAVTTYVFLLNFLIKKVNKQVLIRNEGSPGNEKKCSFSYDISIKVKINNAK